MMISRWERVLLWLACVALGAMLVVHALNALGLFSSSPCIDMVLSWPFLWSFAACQ